MEISEYNLNNNFRKVNADILVDYESAVNCISEILEDISINGKTYDSKCFEAYQTFFEVSAKEKRIILDEMKDWHIKLENFIKIFSYDKAAIEKMQYLKFAIEKFFETYSYMLDRIDKVKESYNNKMEAYKLRNVSSSPISREDMEIYFKQTARFYIDLINQMEDFVDEQVRPKLDLCDIICLNELDFNVAINHHKNKAAEEPAN